MARFSCPISRFARSRMGAVTMAVGHPGGILPSMPEDEPTDPEVTDLLNRMATDEQKHAAFSYLPPVFFFPYASL